MDKGLKDFLGSKKKKKKKSKNQACWYGHAIRNGWFLEELGIKPGDVALSPMGEVIDICLDYHSVLHTTCLVKLYVVSYFGNSFILYLGDLVPYDL